MNKNPFFYPTKSTFGVGVDSTPIVVSEAEIAQQELPSYEDVNVVEHKTIPGLTSIIIPVYLNSYPVFHQTGNCIGSVREHTDKIKTPYEIILVINGKTGINIDPKDTMCDKVIQNEENEGYAKAVNKGIRASFGEYIVILNNDVQVFDNWLEDAQKCLEKIDLVMATPMYGKPWARAVEAKEFRQKTFDNNLQYTFTDFTDFSCVVTKKEVFNNVGLFDEQFFMYCEDLDFLRRMKNEGLKYGSTGNPDTNALINTHHIIGSTSSGVEGNAEMMNESKDKLMAKWGY